MIKDDCEVEILKAKHKKYKITSTILSVALIAGALCVGYKVGYNTVPNEFHEFINFYNTFKETYYEDVDDRTLLDGLYYGLTDSVNDNFTFYTSTANGESQSLSTSGVGLGIVRAVYYGNLLLKRVMKNSPASLCVVFDESNTMIDDIGLKEGDVITKVREVNENESNEFYVFKEHHYGDWSNHLTGEKESKIEVYFNRKVNGITKELHGTITRGDYTQDKVNIDYLDLNGTKKVAQLAISSFLGSGKEARPDEEMKDIFDKTIFKDNDHLDNLIIDLRDNGGGYVDNFCYLLGLFSDDNTVCGGYLYGDGSKSSLKTPKDGVNYNSMIDKYTIIVNQGTASASESFVVGLQDLLKDKVKVVGEISYGKGIAQTFYSVNGDGSLIRYTFAKVISPEGRCINRRGIVPDYYSNYKSIQDDDQYYYYRNFIEGVNDNSSLSSKDKAVIKTRIEALIGGNYDSLESAITKFQSNNKLNIINGVFNEETANKIGDLFFDYYHSYTPSNIYTAFISGSSSYDSHNASEMKMVKNQINLVLGTSYTSFYDAVGGFQDAKGLVGKNHLFDLETSYLLEGMVYDLRMEKEFTIDTQARGL